MTEPEVDEELDRITIKLTEIVKSMFGITWMGIRPPPPPPPRYLEALAKIVGLAETIKELGLESVTKQSHRR